MKKKTNNQFDKVLFGLAIASLLISIVEGLFFYSSAKYPNPLFRFMLIAQNSIRAFAFRGDISLKNIADVLQADPSGIEQIVGYLYAVAVFVAPYCTLKFIYKILDKLLRFKNWHPFSQKPRIVIFGYNDEVDALLSDEPAQDKKSAYHIHIVSTQISDNDERDLRRRGISVHRVDCLKLDAQQLKYFFKQMELHKAYRIVLFHESSAQNFSLYKLFHNSDKPSFALKDDVKIFCRCENQSIRQILEDYHDRNQGLDLEVISLPELRVRTMLEQYPLHRFYVPNKSDGDSKDSETNRPREDRLIPAEQWHLHLLIVGFGKLGQEFLLQAMNLGVVSSKNNILIDVIDFKMEEKQNIFANYFNRNYVDMGETEFSIPTDRADGTFVVRFHKMDIRYQRFYEQLVSCGKDGVFTYVAICVEDEDVALHSMCAVQRYLQHHTSECTGETVIGVRMEADRQMAVYLNGNDKTYKNVFAISDSASVITLSDLLHEDLDRDAKNFNSIYSSIQIQSGEKTAQLSSKQPKKETKNQPTQEQSNAEDPWRKLALFKRDSSRALAQHSKIKETVFNDLDLTVLEEMFGTNGTLLKKVDENVWAYDDLDHYIANLSDREAFPWVEELSKTEHRRWCYFMASRGWQRATPEDKGKEKKALEFEKKNECMCTWDDLLLTRKDTCPYDLMWLLLKYNKKCEEANTAQAEPN